eukprot:653637-Prorocentrum_lima.AAC.1
MTVKDHNLHAQKPRACQLSISLPCSTTSRTETSRRGWEEAEAATAERKGARPSCLRWTWP